MAKTAAERQAEYRARAAVNGEKRLNMFIHPELHNALRMMAAYEERSVKEVLEDLIRTKHARYCVDLSEEDFERYNVTPK